MIRRTPFDTLSIKYVSDLHNLLLPDFQRDADTVHVDAIYNDILHQLNNGREPRLTGCLITVSTIDSTYLLDGNHRLKALRRLLDTGHNLKVYVQEITVADTDEAERLFNQANTSFPVAEMPPGVKRSLVNDIAVYFYKKYTGGSAMKTREPLFKDNPSGTVRRPRISRSKFEVAIGQLLEHGFDPSMIKERIDHHINELNGKSLSYFKRSGDTIAKLTKSLEDADLFGCRLGMDMNDNYFTTLSKIMGLPVTEENIKYIRPREQIPKALRLRVWDRYCGASVRIDKCPFCQREIRLENFHCAHNVSSAAGGETNIDNLYPCCGECNLSMGVSHFEDWLTHWRT